MSLNIFYSYSNHNDDTLKTYNLIYEHFNKDNKNQIKIIDVDNNDIDNNVFLIEKIKYHIDNSHIFVCDITPDYVIDEIKKVINEMNLVHNNIPNNEIENYYDKKYSSINSNVMLELGYALSSFNNSNILLVQNEKTIKKIPSLLNGFTILYYNSENIDYHLDIIDKISEFKNNYFNLLDENYKNDDDVTDKFKIYRYHLSVKFKTQINELLDIEYFKYYNIIYNKKDKFIELVKNNNVSRYIDITKKVLELKNKTVCLSCCLEIYNELQHIELMIELKFKNN